VHALDETFPPQAGADRSIELDPGRIDEAFLDAVLALGFTRISFGIQDLDQEVLQRVGRRENPATVARLHQHLRGRGFEAVSFDLMIGLPGQTPATFEATLRQVISMGPGRLALFPYAHVPWMRPHQKALEQWTIPDTGDRLRLYALAHRLLGAAGYAPIGMDHFARPGDELMEAAADFRLHRNFMGYTTRPGLDQIALGVSAISDLGGVYAQNVKDVETYQQRLAEGVLPLDRGFLMSAEDLLRRDVIMSLLCNFQVDLEPLAARSGRSVDVAFGPELARLAPLVEDGLIQPFGPEGQLRVTTTGLPFVRLVCAVFDQYLAPQAAELRYSTSL
jgi:oxygen-independent coproporphyrinogen-3 oxidase